LINIRGKRGPAPELPERLRLRGSTVPRRREGAAKQQAAPAAELVRLPMPRPARGPDLRRRIKQLPGYDPYRDSKGYRFDLGLARKAVGFFSDELTHVKGADSRPRLVSMVQSGSQAAGGMRVNGYFFKIWAC